MNDFYNRLDELYSSGDLRAVEVFLSDAVAMAGENSPECAGLLNELASFYRGVSRYAESEQTFEQSLRIFESAGMESTPEYATVLLNLAGLYRIMGDADRAITLFLSAMKRLEEADAGDSYAYVSILNNLALAYQAKGELTQALEYASRALDMMRASSDAIHEIATSLNNLASIHLQLGNLNLADKHITEALAIYDAIEESDVHHAAALTTRAALMSRRGEHQDALGDFRRALELTKRFFGENIEYAICRCNIAEVCELLGDTPSAIAELSDAARIMDKLLGPDHPSIKNVRAKLERLNEGQAEMS